MTKPLSFKDKEESYASFNTNGTGPFMLVRRQPGIRTVYKRNPNWWGSFEGNVQEVSPQPISNDATRLAALVSGEIDLVLDPAPRDVPRLRATARRAGDRGAGEPPDLRRHGPGARHAGVRPLAQRQEPVPGPARAPRDVPGHRHRRHPQRGLMNGLSQPTGALTPSPLGAFGDPALETRLPFDLAAARKAMADAGYARRLRGDAGLPQQPLHQRRGHLPRPGGDVGADQGEGEGERDAARHCTSPSWSATRPASI